MKSHQQSLKEWLDNRIRFKTVHSSNTIHSRHVFEVICREHLRGGLAANISLWRVKKSPVHKSLHNAVKVLLLAGLSERRIDNLFDGVFDPQRILQCRNDKDVVLLLKSKFPVWRAEAKA